VAVLFGTIPIPKVPVSRTHLLPPSHTSYALAITKMYSNHAKNKIKIKNKGSCAGSVPMTTASKQRIDNCHIRDKYILPTVNYTENPSACVDFSSSPFCPFCPFSSIFAPFSKPTFATGNILSRTQYTRLRQCAEILVLSCPGYPGGEGSCDRPYCDYVILVLVGGHLVHSAHLPTFLVYRWFVVAIFRWNYNFGHYSIYNFDNLQF
jgi:hypothetical protein